MKLKTLFFAAATTVAFTGSAAKAVPQDVLDAIIADLAAQGFTKLEVKNFNDTVIIEASGPNGKLERVYDAAGTVTREESTISNSTGDVANDGTGEIDEMEMEEDDSDDDDESDDHDGYHDGGNDHDDNDDHDDDDDEDDDEGDDDD